MAEPTLWIAEGEEPFCGLAREERLLEEAAAGPVLYLYRFRRPAVVLGYAQKAEEADLAACRRRGLPVLRRLTGGTGVLHEESLSLSLGLPAGHPLAEGVHALYGAFVSAVQSVLLSLGIPVRRWRPADGSPRRRSPLCFEDHLGETLLLDGRKVLGCAQTRRLRAVLVHGVLPLSLDPEAAADVFRVDPRRVRAAMAPLPLPAGTSPGLLGERLAAAFKTLLGEELCPAPPPPLSPLLQARRGDRRWVILEG
ncbi:MAG: lipoate--protein ligase family protein [Acidobacteriota bacterium]